MTGQAKTSIPLKPPTRDRLKALGVKGQSYDDIVNRLLDERGKAAG